MNSTETRGPALFTGCALLFGTAIVAMPLARPILESDAARLAGLP